MNDQELRALIRDAVVRHIGPQPASAGSPASRNVAATTEPPWAQHASHAIYLTVVNVGDACVIEPAVPCNHCGYCKSHGY